jgi:hypothetical protein
MEKKTFTFIVYVDVTPCSITVGVPKFQESHLQSFAGKKGHIILSCKWKQQILPKHMVLLQKRTLYF